MAYTNRAPCEALAAEGKSIEEAVCPSLLVAHVIRCLTADEEGGD